QHQLPAKPLTAESVLTLHRKRQLRECSHGDAAGPLGVERLRLLPPRRAGDIEMRPWQIAGEFFEEHRRGNRSGRPAARVREVSALALQLLRSEEHTSEV